MDFFNKIGDIANKTYKKTSQKTGEIAKEAKLKMKMFMVMLYKPLDQLSMFNLKKESYQVF